MKLAAGLRFRAPRLIHLANAIEIDLVGVRRIRRRNDDSRVDRGQRIFTGEGESIFSVLHDGIDIVWAG